VDYSSTCVCKCCLVSLNILRDLAISECRARLIIIKMLTSVHKYKVALFITVHTLNIIIAVYVIIIILGFKSVNISEILKFYIAWSFLKFCILKNVIFWDDVPHDSCKSQSWEECSVRWLLVAANVLSSQILVTLMMETLHSPETSVLTRSTRRNIPEDDIHSHLRENLKSYKQNILTAWLTISCWF
jgi:hypothetical protein